MPNPGHLCGDPYNRCGARQWLAGTPVRRASLAGVGEAGAVRVAVGQFEPADVVDVLARRAAFALHIPASGRAVRRRRG